VLLTNFHAHPGLVFFQNDRHCKYGLLRKEQCPWIIHKRSHGYATANISHVHG